MPDDFQDLSQIRHVQPEDPVGSKQTSQPTRALELRLQRLEQLAFDRANNSELGQLIIRNVAIKTGDNGVVLNNAVFFNPNTGLYEPAMATVTLVSGVFRSNPSAMSIGILVAINGNKGDVMIGGYSKWIDNAHRQSMMEGSEKFQPGVPYYLSANEPGKLTRFAPTLRIQVLLATDAHFIVAPVFSTPETIENIYRNPIGMRPVGSLRLVPETYNHFTIVGFDGMELYDTADNLWRSTNGSGPFDALGYMVADADVKIDKTVWIRAVVKSNGGGVEIFSAKTLEELQVGGSSIFNVNSAYDGLTELNYDAKREYIVTDSAGNDLGTLFFKFTGGDTTYERHVVFKFPEMFQGWKMVNASIPPVAEAEVENGKVTSIVVKEGSFGYATAPAVKITGGGGSGAKAEAVLNDFGSITSIKITNPGSGYTSTPGIEFPIQVTSVDVLNGGSGCNAVATVNDGVVDSVSVTAPGSNYFTEPAVEILDAGGDGKGAQAIAVVSGGRVVDLKLLDGGSGYVSPVVRVLTPNTGYRNPSVAFSDPDTIPDSTPEATLLPGSKGLLAVNIHCGGNLYAAGTTVTAVGGGATTPATLKPVIQNGVIVGIKIINPGAGYTSVPTFVFGSKGSGHGCVLEGRIGCSVLGVTVTSPGEWVWRPRLLIGDQIGNIELESFGAGYSASDTVTVEISEPDVPGGVQATAVARLGGAISRIFIDDPGIGYNPASVTWEYVDAKGGSGAVLIPLVDADGKLISVEIVNPGYGFTDNPTIKVVDGSGDKGAVLRVSIQGKDQVVAVDVINQGSGYVNPPTVEIVGGVDVTETAKASVKWVIQPALTETNIAGYGGPQAGVAGENPLQVFNYNEDLDDGQVAFARPVNAAFYYNVKADPELKLRYPANPVDKCSFVLNGVELLTTLFSETLGTFADDRADVGLSRKTIFWNTSDVNGSPWDKDFEHFVKDNGVSSGAYTVPGTGVTGATLFTGEFHYRGGVYGVEDATNRAWLHINKASRFHQSNRVSSLSALSPLRLIDMTTGVDAKDDGTPMGGQLLIALDDQVNLLTKWSDQIDASKANELKAIYVNTTGRSVILTSVMLMVVFQANKDGVLPTIEQAAKISIGTQEGNYRNIVGVTDANIKSTRLYAINQVKEVFPDSDQPTPLILPNQKVFLKISLPAGTPIEKQLIVARVKGHVF